MRKPISLLVATTLAASTLAVPMVSAQTLSLTEIYDPGPAFWAIPVGPDETNSDLWYPRVPRENIRDVDLKLGESPFPIELTHAWLDGIKLKLNPERIYPESFKVPYSAVIYYIDGTHDVVVGDLEIDVLDTLVKDGVPGVSPTVTPTPILTTTVTSTRTFTPAPVTTTETKTETVTKEPAPVTTTETKTETVTKEPAPSVTTVTVTEKPQGGNADEGSSEGGKIAGIIAAVLAVIAAIGGGAYWFTNMR